MSHVSMCIFQTFQREFGKQHSFGCQLGPGSSGAPCSVSGGLPLTAASWPTLQACFASWDPRPLGAPAHAPVGAWRIPSWGRVSVSAFRSDRPPSAPIAGWPRGPAAPLASSSNVKDLHQHQEPELQETPLSPTASSLGPSLPFLHPSSRGPLAEGENLSAPGGSLQRPHPRPLCPLCAGHTWGLGRRVLLRMDRVPARVMAGNLEDGGEGGEGSPCP